MKIFGFEIKRRAIPDGLLSIWSSGSPHWRPLWGDTAEPFAGAWQRNINIDNRDSLLMFSAVFCCVTGIASDIAKNRIKLCKEDSGGIWVEVKNNSPFLPVLTTPNSFQNHIQFIEHWIESKLLSGNTYVLLERDNRGAPGGGVVNAMYVLDPCRVKPLIAPNGEVFYDLGEDYLNQVEEHIIVPASEIIHDRMNCLRHPLIGVSPLYACALSVLMGNKIQANSTQFFANQSLPGGMLTAPGRLSTETMQSIKASFEEKFSGANIGRLFVAGDGLKFEPLTMTAEQADLTEQLKWTVSDVARAFHYPEFKLDASKWPPYSSGPEALTLMYYTDCLQEKIEKLEACLDDGLRLPSGYGTELDIDNLLRMDTASLFESNGKAVGGGWMSPDEARFRANFSKVEGGDTPYLQQQNYSLAALAKRDAGDDPFSKSTPTPTAPSPTPESQRSFEEYDIEEFAVSELTREIK